MLGEHFCEHCDGEGSHPQPGTYYRTRCESCGGSGDARDKWPLDDGEFVAEMDRRARNFAAIAPLVPAIVIGVVMEERFARKAAQ